MKIYEKKDKSIMCPKCGNFLTKVDKKDTRKYEISCKKCRRLIKFVPCSDEESLEIKKIPERTQSSGMRFY